MFRHILKVVNAHTSALALALALAVQCCFVELLGCTIRIRRLSFRVLGEVLKILEDKRTIDYHMIIG